MGVPFDPFDFDPSIGGFPPDAIFMQFTGLKDKKGTEIYEGDILQFGKFALNDTDVFGEEPWNNLPDGVKENDFSTLLHRHVVYYNIKDLYHLLMSINDNPDVIGVEVIGNIFEHRHLLEK